MYWIYNVYTHVRAIYTVYNMDITYGIYRYRYPYVQMINAYIYIHKLYIHIYTLYIYVCVCLYIYFSPKTHLLEY